jgi:hypothetical protein
MRPSNLFAAETEDVLSTDSVFNSSPVNDFVQTYNPVDTCSSNSNFESSFADRNEELSKEHTDLVSGYNKRFVLGRWATSFNINHNALGGLLDILKTWMPNEDFPKDPRTLLKTQRNVILYNFGLTNAIT